MGGTVAGLGQVGNTAGLGGVLQGLGATVSSVGGLLNATPGNTNPLGNTLANATGTVAARPAAWAWRAAGGNGGLLSPITGILGGVGGVGGTRRAATAACWRRSPACWRA